MDSQFGEGTAMNDESRPDNELGAQYRRRFEEENASRGRVWRALIDGYFVRYVRGSRSVLDLGCGWGHFINQIDVPEKHAIDLNEEASDHIDSAVSLYVQPANERWPIPDASLDLVFTSNLLEHLPGPMAVTQALAEARRCLRPGGRLVCMGPNIRAVGGAYWDFFDHVVPLTERSLAEALELSGFEIETVIGRFLPYTMAGRPPAPSYLIRAYLMMRPIWRVLGGQFLVVARVPTSAPE